MLQYLVASEPRQQLTLTSMAKCHYRYWFEGKLLKWQYSSSSAPVFVVETLQLPENIVALYATGRSDASTIWVLDERGYSYYVQCDRKELSGGMRLGAHECFFV